MNDMIEHGCRLEVADFWWQHLIISSLGRLLHDACEVILLQHIKVIGLYLRKEEKLLLGVFTLQSFHYCQCPALVDHVGLRMGSKRQRMEHIHRHLGALQCVFYLLHMIVMVIWHCVLSFFLLGWQYKIDLIYTVIDSQREISLLHQRDE